MTNRKIVWALFDDGAMSIQNALDKEKYEVYSFGIKNMDKGVNYLDLSKSSSKFFLDDYPKPDIIVASPPCESFSRASAMKGGNACYRVDKNKIISARENEDYIGTRYNPIKQNQKRVLGAKMIGITIEIINKFKPKFWYIENPRFSLMWNFINQMHSKNWGVANFATYSKYDAQFNKPTNFLSNIKLNLKYEIIKGLKGLQNVNGDKRSEIPSSLIQDIFRKFEENEFWN